MKTMIGWRMYAAAGVLAASPSFAVTSGQSSFPANPSTALPNGSALPAPITATGVARNVGRRSPAQRATVSFAAGMLDVRANNSSLNQILRDIGQSTGMKITGGVVDQRVFGSYGPATPSTVLATLLDGTGVNMLLREGAGEAPLELVLTPRTGGVTPPDPNAGGSDDMGSDEPIAPSRPGQPSPRSQGFGGQVPVEPGSTSLPVLLQPTATQQAPPTATQQMPPNSQTFAGSSPTSGNAGATSAGGFAGSPGNQSVTPPPLNNVNGSSLNTTPTASQIPTTNSVPLDTLGAPTTTPPSSGIVDTPNQTGPGSVLANGNPPAATNAVKTPEQIYQQLLQMQQQNKKSQ